MASPPFPCPTKVWHNNTYAEIDPKRPELSAKGKRIVITGGGIGIGRETARAFAAAGADTIVLLGGRREQLLQETQKAIQNETPNVKVTYQALDISDFSAVKNIAKHVEKWDVLVLNAAYMPTPRPVLEADMEDTAKSLAVNFSGNLHIVQSLLPLKASNAVVIAVSTGAVSLDVKMLQANAAYMSAKFALAKLVEIMAAEVPDCRWFTAHPGIVETDMLLKSGFHGLVPTDDASLPGHFFVWLASDEAAFLSGKFVWSNWDVGELKARAEEIKSSAILTTNVVGWPF